MIRRQVGLDAMRAERQWLFDGMSDADVRAAFSARNAKQVRHMLARSRSACNAPRRRGVMVPLR
jgi:hypothetical protein